jgi:hypothetical protein
MLLVPTSAGASKSGEDRNLMRAVTLSEVTRVNRAESVPEVIIIVEDSFTEIVAAFEVVSLFSAKEKVVAFVKVGAVVSGV